MSKTIRICALVICICANVSFALIIQARNQETIPQNEGEKLAQCYDENVNLKIERLERTTQIFEGLISKLLSEGIDNKNENIPSKNMNASFMLLRQTQIDMSTDLNELKITFKHLNNINEHFKKNLLELMDESFYNHTSKLAENMKNLYIQKTQELELLFNEKLISKEIKNVNTRDYDEHLNCLKNCNVTSELPKTCAEAKMKRDFVDEIHELYIPNSDLQPFYAFCTFENDEEKAWTIIQRREDGSQNFNRNWKDYKDGFGDAYGEYWLGLERLHWMTKDQPHELWIFLVDYKGEERFAKYSKFSISNESEGYKLTLGRYSGNAGDALAPHNNKKFATYDQDENGCGEYLNSGWWFYCGYMCNLNGIFRSFSTQKMSMGIQWRSWHYNSMKYTHMAIRPF